MEVPLLDLKEQYRSIKDEILPELEALFQTQQFILGSKVAKCEQEIADYVQSSHACGVSSGTDALLMALMAEGIGPGDEVITTPYSFFATSGSIARLGAKAVFVDIDPVTFNINPQLIPAKINSRTRAIMPVHLFGQAADMKPILKIAHERKLSVIEDAAQAIGAEYEGRRVGSLGDYGCFSFFPSKNLGCFGDGGMVVCQNDDKAKKLKALRNHGSEKRYYHQILGGNFRLDALQAAVVSVKLRHLEFWTQKRIGNADLYKKLFTASGLIASGQIRLPEVARGRHVYNQFIIRAQRRDELMAFLKEKGVGCEVYYPLCLHLQECFRDWGYKTGDFPVSEQASAETLALPVYPELSHASIEYVVATIKAFYG